MTDSRDDQFRAYVLASRGQLLRTATFLTSGDRHAAEDLVQTALMRLYVAWPRVRRETVDAYARRSMLNALIDNRRRPAARLERIRSEVPEVAIDDPAPSGNETEVFRALAELPPKMRAAVVLRYLLDLSVAETADSLNCSEGTVKSQSARGLDQLRAALAPTDVPPTGLQTDAPSVDLRHAEASVRTPDLGDTDE
ncbi:MAG: SigE family RNA polymerase sigma factor [Frankiaceae bacterium]|nr:SigE family RNA polymerase sigma factor [Frankiaceae bacterium]